jgi:hypothetical protein
MLLSELSGRARIKYSTALAFALGLKRLKVSLAIFHQCQSRQNRPVQVKPFGEGYPGTPYRCPRCRKLVSDRNELSYDILIRH